MEYSYAQRRISGGINADDRYWESLEEGCFRLPRCAACARWMWPAHWRCGGCGCWDQEWVALDPVARVFSWTKTWYSFDRVRERASQVPYVVVVAEVPAADGTRVLGVLTGPEDGLAFGAPVRGVIRPPAPESKHYPSLQWELVRSDGDPAEVGS